MKPDRQWLRVLTAMTIVYLACAVFLFVALS